MSVQKTTFLKMLTAEKKILTFFSWFFLCHLTRDVQVILDKKEYSVMTKVGRKIRDVSCINFHVVKGVVLQQSIFRAHCTAGLCILKKAQHLGTLKMVSKVIVFKQDSKSALFKGIPALAYGFFLRY